MGATLCTLGGLAVCIYDLPYPPTEHPTSNMKIKLLPDVAKCPLEARMLRGKPVQVASRSVRTSVCHTGNFKPLNAVSSNSHPEATPWPLCPGRPGASRRGRLGPLVTSPQLHTAAESSKACGYLSCACPHFTDSRKYKVKWSPGCHSGHLYTWALAAVPLSAPIADTVALETGLTGAPGTIDWPQMEIRREPETYGRARPADGGGDSPHGCPCLPSAVAQACPCP